MGRGGSLVDGGRKRRHGQQRASRKPNEPGRRAKKKMSENSPNNKTITIRCLRWEVDFRGCGWGKVIADEDYRMVTTWKSNGRIVPGRTSMSTPTYEERHGDDYQRLFLYFLRVENSRGNDPPTTAADNAAQANHSEGPTVSAAPHSACRRSAAWCCWCCFWCCCHLQVSPFFFLSL